MSQLDSTDGFARDALGGQSVSLVLPAWNEAAAITRAIAEADTALSRVATQYEIIVVDDGSQDDTAELTLKMAAMLPAVRLVRHENNFGYAAALRSGFAAAKFDFVAFTDADNQFDLAELDRFLLLSKSYQVVCGYRIDRQDSWRRRFYSRAYNLLVRCFLNTGVRDVDCALKMFHRNALHQLAITSNGFLVNSELLTQARQRKLSIVEVGVSHRPRTEGVSTVSAAHIPGVATELLCYWWNRVQFPGEESLGDSNALPRRHPSEVRNWIGRAQLLLLLVATVFLLVNLSYPLIDRDETRYAEIPREMVVTGNWILPQLNFRPYNDKPPLLYWLCAASYSIFGVSEWAARLVPAVSAIGTLTATMWFGSRMFGKRAGLLAGVVLLLSVGFLATSRLLLIDGLLTLLSTVSLFSAHEAVRSRKLSIGWWTTASIACGLAFLAKGPIVLVLLVPPVASFSLLTRRVSRPRLTHWLLMAGIVAVIAGPWFIAVSLQDAEFVKEFFYRHNFRRFAGAFHERPIWYFAPVVLIAGHPWTYLTLPYARFLLGRGDDERRRRPPSLGFLVLWSTCCFTFFSVSRCKLPAYILPAAPALALMLGHYLEQVLFLSLQGLWSNFARRWSPWLAASTTCLAGMGVWIFAVLDNLEQPTTAIPVISVCGLLSTVALAMGRCRVPATVGWSVCAVSALLFASIMLHREIPRYASAQTLFGPGSPCRATLRSVADVPLATVAHEWSEVPFYLRRDDVQNFSESRSASFREFASRHKQFILVVRKHTDLTDVRAQLPEKADLVSIAERGPAQLVLATIRHDRDDLAQVQNQTESQR